MALLFVYGTLKRGCKNHSIMSGVPFEGNAEAPGLLINLGPFPGYLYDPGHFVSGELYKVDDIFLKRADRFEGVPSLYTREEIQVRNLDTEQVEMAYVYQVTHGTIEAFSAVGNVIPSGVWVE